MSYSKVISGSAIKERTERERELERLAGFVVDATSRDRRDEEVARLLAFIGVIHNTPKAKRTFISRTPSY